MRTDDAVSGSTGEDLSGLLHQIVIVSIPTPETTDMGPITTNW